MTQQIHSFRASGVRFFQAACVFASDLSATRKSVGVLCTGPHVRVLLSFIVSSMIDHNAEIDNAMQCRSSRA
jgi:hypothetical protein